MADMYSESVLASYVTYKELYANNNYRSAYQILAEFIKYTISVEEIYSFSVPELKKKINDVFGFKLPTAVIRSSLRKIEYIERTQNSEDYTVNRQNLRVDLNFSKYKEKAEKENNILTENLISYVEQNKKNTVNRKELIQELIAYLLDESNGGKYQEIISAFILENSENEEFVNQLNAIREGSILYMGLNCNITETGSLTQELTLYLDTEILFDIYGYNGEVFQSLAEDLIGLVREANRLSRKIKLRYFEETKKEVSDFFLAATEIVKNGTFIRENVAMKAIVNGCKDSTDVSDKESDFYHKLQYQYGIIPDEHRNYYSEADYTSNLESSCLDEEEQKNLKNLSNINKLRKNEIHHDYTKTGYLFITETRKTLEMAKQLAEEIVSDKGESEEGNICRLAVNMSFLTNILWYKLNRGFGAGVLNYPHNLNSVIKAKIVLANFISQNVTATYNKYRKEYTEGRLSAEQMAGRLLGLREKASKPEDITIDNLSDNLNFDPNYLCRYEEERELQRVKLEEKEELIQQLTINSKASQEELQEVKSVAESSRKIISNQDMVIANQKAEIEEKDRLLEQYQAEEREKEKKKARRKKIMRFAGAILLRALFIIVVGIIAYCIAKAAKADAPTTVGCIVSIIGIVLSAIDIVKRVYHNIFDEENEN